MEPVVYKPRPRPLTKRMPAAFAALGQDPVVKAVYKQCRGLGVEAYVVGGVLRDIALSMPMPNDYDFVVMGKGKDARLLADSLAVALDGRAFILDKETYAYRVAYKTASILRVIDVSPVKYGSITKDLRSRDFTVNAFGLGLSSLFEPGKPPAIIDPADGMADAQKRTVRATGRRVFDEDPLRTLRALRLSQQYGLKIDGETNGLIKEKAHLLSKVSLERIRDELVLIFGLPGAKRSIVAMQRLGILKAILPECASWHKVNGYNLLRHGLKTVEQAETLVEGSAGDQFPSVSPELERHFEKKTGNLGRKALLKMAAFFHDIGKPMTMSVADGRMRFTGHENKGANMMAVLMKRLCFSRSVAACMASLVKNHHRVFQLAKLKRASPRAKAHLIRSVERHCPGAGVELALLAIADAIATRGVEDKTLRRCVAGLLAYYYGTFLRKRPRPVLSGDEIMKIFRVPEGPLVGAIIRVVAAGVEAGEIESVKEAVIYVRKRINLLSFSRKRR